MASSYYTNTLHVSFESFLAMDNPGTVSMFKALMAYGLQKFLGCPAVIYEAALIDFFENASIRDGVIVSTVAGKLVKISEELFAETFELLVEGLTDLTDIPEDKVFDAKSIVSLSGYPEKVLMMTTIVCEVRINWNSILFNILKEMVTPSSRQGKGYAVQLSLLLENVPNLELGDSSEFPSSKILTENTVHRYITQNDKVGMEDAADAPKVTRAPKKKATSKKRPAAVPVAEPVFSLPTTATPDFTKALAQLRASIEQIRDRDYGSKLKDTLLLHLHDMEKRFTSRCDEQDRVLGVLRKDSHNQNHLLSLDIKSSQKQLSAQTATAAFDVVDVRREVKELNAKVTYLDEQVAATRNDLLEFSARAQESLNLITDQLSELLNYINRGGNDKKGEDSSSRGPQPPPDDQGRGSGNTGGENVLTTDIVERFSGSMSREGRGKGRSGERRSSGNRSGHSKRRRYDSGGKFRRSFEDWLG
ncbi:hypothetical protein F511_32686 [Dorcoceras hygrometricum]|uniref:Uncharacterized protein n=1 Tax=Dorcoceras hygrometricum TaxID=472368 RepID=A0A2Z7B6B7_9LAMI|nr:hypothetical protein F511_32686 [Dorcoceras hygrometricum]